MGRAEIRRIEREKRKTKTATYNLTKAQLTTMVKVQMQEEMEQMKQESMDNSVNTAMLLLLTLPLEVLMDFYWTKSYARRIPEFTNHVLDYYKKWQNGELDMEKLQADLWEYGGVKLVREDGNEPFSE